MYPRNAGSKKDLRVSGRAKRMDLSFSRSYLEGGKSNEYTWRAQYNVKLHAAFGKNESFPEKKESRDHSLIRIIL
jgi:hypothetical protein